ncbi:MAG: acyl-CoA dehydrogenase family protein [Deltaproteobacteria bacterium]|nr:acyl-CoA dehydrogenase family protein [Deltaproteobacteria bacterium]
MDFKLSEKHLLLQRAIREFAEKSIAPRVAEMEETQEFPEDLISEMGKLGLLGLIIPTQYGGTDMGFLARVLALEQISLVSAAAGMTLQTHHTGLAAILDHGSEEQKQKYLPRLSGGESLAALAVTEPSGGSDLMGMQSTARPEGDHYVANGRKCFISNSHLAKIHSVVLRTGEGSKGLSIFVVEAGTPGFRPGRKEHKCGLLGVNTGELILQDCRIPKENLIAGEGAGLRAVLKTISEVGRSGMAATALGIIGASLEKAVQFSKDRVLYGKPIANLQGIQWLVAEIYSDLEIARLLCYRAGWLRDEGKRCDVEATLAKAFTCEAAVRAARNAVSIYGGYGIMKEYDVQRYLRDALTCVPADGTADISKVILARHALS